MFGQGKHANGDPKFICSLVRLGLDRPATIDDERRRAAEPRQRYLPKYRSLECGGTRSGDDQCGGNDQRASRPFQLLVPAQPDASIHQGGGHQHRVSSRGRASVHTLVAENFLNHGTLILARQPTAKNYEYDHYK